MPRFIVFIHPGRARVGEGAGGGGLKNSLFGSGLLLCTYNKVIFQGVLLNTWPTTMVDSFLYIFLCLRFVVPRREQGQHWNYW